MSIPPHPEAQTVFVERFMPEIESRASALLADHGPEAREDAQQEILAQTWAGFLSAWRRGRRSNVTPFTLTAFAYRHYRSGRRLVRCGRSDAMSDRSRARGKVKLVRTDSAGHETFQGRARLHLDPADTVRWKLDVAAVIETLSERQQMVLALTAAGWKNHEIAGQLGVSPSRVTQILDEVGEAFMEAGYGPA